MKKKRSERRNRRMKIGSAGGSGKENENYNQHCDIT